MPYISKDNPCYFFTSVTNSRLPIFRTDTLKEILCTALDEARRSGNFRIHAYSVMPDHLHAVTGGELAPSNTLRYLNGISARRIVDHLKNTGHHASLEKLKIQARGTYKYSVWQHHSNTFIITSEAMMMQKVGYVHRNPIDAGLVDSAGDYRFSSARYWLREQLLENEPIEVDSDKIVWRG
ncbi:MAG: transposase [Pyrinomonadaceae bacterium]